MAPNSANTQENESIKKENLEFVQLESQDLGDGKSGIESPVYGIDEAHQKRVMCVPSSLSPDPTIMSQLTSVRISRRVDLRLLPILGIMYSISLIDRTNLGLAFVAGMDEDLGLHIGSRYTIIVMVFFVAYM